MKWLTRTNKFTKAVTVHAWADGATKSMCTKVNVRENEVDPALYKSILCAACVKKTAKKR